MNVLHVDTFLKKQSHIDGIWVGLRFLCVCIRVCVCVCVHVCMCVLCMAYSVMHVCVVL